MNINNAFPSTYLKAADLQGRRANVTIENVQFEDIGGDEKPVVYFQNKSRGMVLNKTNANMIAEIANSTETDEWPGVKICLYATKVDFQGRRVDAIRVDYSGTGTPKGKAKPARESLDVDNLPEDAPF